MGRIRCMDSHLNGSKYGNPTQYINIWMCWIFVSGLVGLRVINFWYFQEIFAASFDNHLTAIGNNKNAIQCGHHCFSGVLSIMKNRQNNLFSVSGTFMVFTNNFILHNECCDPVFLFELAAKELIAKRTSHL